VVMRVACYCRVSTEQQVEKYGLKAQKRILADYCQSKGWRAKFYVDEGISGETIAARPAMQRLLSDARAGRLDVALAVEMERFSRSTDLFDWLTIRKTFREAGVRFGTPAQLFDPVDTEDAFLSVLFGALSAREKQKFVERTSRGRLEAVRSGKYFSSTPPFGYGSQDGYLAVNEAEAKVVREIFAMAKGGKAIRAIARELNRRGIPTPMQARGNPRAGKAWGKSTVARILKAKLYTGEAPWNRRVGSKKKTMRPESEWIIVKIPAIIPREDFDAVQSLLERNAAFAKRHQVHEYLLKGLLYCECGAKMYGCFSKGRRYYTCSAKCGRHSARADDEERRAFTHAFRALENPEIVVELKRKARADNPKRAAVAERLAEIDSRLERLPKERERVVDAYQSGFIDKAEARRRVNRIDKLGARLEKERKTLQARGATIVSQEARRAAWLQAVKALRAAKANPSKSRRKKARFASLEALLTEWRDGEAPPRNVLELKQKVIRGVFERIIHREDGGSEYVAVVPIKGQLSAG
jgi:site-specific DNA recombinase